MTIRLPRAAALSACLLLAAAAAAAAVAVAAEAVRTPRILREGQPDTSSVEAIVDSIIRPGMTQEQKALAVYEFLRTHVYHWAAPREGAKPDSHDYGVVYDPVRLVNVYGYGYCFQNRAALEALWQAAGLEARSAGIGGHSVAEVYYDGGYHYIDADQHGYCLLPDGRTVASLEQIARDPIGLLLRQPDPSKPFFPSTAAPKVPYESKYIVAAYYASTADNFYQHDKTVTGHRMDITLLPGMRLVRRFRGDGRWNLRNKNIEFEYKVGYVDPRVGPKDFLSDTGYGTGELLYQPDLTAASGEYPAGVWAEENISRTAEGLQPAAAGKPAWCVFRVRLPYVIAGWPTAFQGPAKPAGAATVSAAFRRAGEKDTAALSVSVDSGLSWKPAWQADGTGEVKALVDLSEHVAGRYEYLVRLEFSAAEKPADARVERLAVNTAFQLAPRALPAVREGANRFTFSLGEETETLEFEPDMTGSDGFLRDVESAKGIWFESGQIVGRRGREGEIVCRLEPPRPGEVRSFHAGAGCRREVYSLHPGDDVKIWYAENEPRDWKLLYDDDVPTYANHWSYEADAGAKCSPGTKRVYVKYTIRTEASAAIQRLRLYAHWQPDGGGGLPERGVRVEHAWTEAGQPRSFSRVIRKAPESYEVAAGKDVENVAVVIEPVRERKLAWRVDDPPVRRPPEPAEKVLEEAVRDEMRSLLAAIDADPAKGLAAAAKSKLAWLAGGAKQAQAMLGARYPLPAPTASFGGEILKAGGAAIGRKEPAGAGDIEALAEALAKAADPASRTVPAAALALLGEERGLEPLAEYVKSVPAAKVIDQAVVLVKAGHAAGRKAAADVMSGANQYDKLKLLGAVDAAGIDPLPAEVLAGLADPSRWVRLKILDMVRRRPGGEARAAVEKAAREDPLEFLRAEARSVLESMDKAKEGK